MTFEFVLYLTSFFFPNEMVKCS